MSNSKLNIQELEKKFIELLDSFTDEEIREWERFDNAKMELEKFFNGEFQPVIVGEVEYSTERKESIPLNSIEVNCFVLNDNSVEYNLAS